MYSQFRLTKRLEVKGQPCVGIQLLNKLEIRSTVMCGHEKTFGCYIHMWFHSVLDIFMHVCSLIVPFCFYCTACFVSIIT